MPRKLYHYCSLETLKAILQGKCFRLSDVSKSNDFMEREWASAILKDILISFFKENKIEIDLTEEYYYTDSIKNHLEYILSEVKMRNDYLTFTMCFSDDGDVLSQWRGYADDGFGVAIGFNYSEVSKINRRDSPIRLAEILYEEVDQADEIIYAAESALEYARDFAKHMKDYVRITHGGSFDKWLEDELETFGEVFADYMKNVSIIIKNPAFKEENESRIFYNSKIYKFSEHDDLTDKLDKSMKINKFDLKPLDFFIRNNNLVSYMDLSFERRVDDGIISEIVIGPCSKLKEEDIRLMLSKYGFDSSSISVVKSKASYQIK